MDKPEKLQFHKIRLAVGCALTVILWCISFVYLRDAGVKKIVIFTALSIGCGVLIVLPRIQVWYLQLLLLAGYLWYVPQKIYERTELPVHDMSRIQPGVQIATILIILFLYAALLLLTQRIRFALSIGTTILMILSLINIYVDGFRGTGIAVGDLLAIGTGISVMGNYQLYMEPEIWYTILYFLFFIFLGAWIDLPWKSVRYHIVISLVALLGIGGFAYFWNESGYIEAKGLTGHYWNSVENEELNGFYLGLLISIDEYSMDRPTGYSTVKAEALEASYLSQIESATTENGETVYVPSAISAQSPNIIMIMNEAWSDLRALGNLETTESCMPFTDSLAGGANSDAHQLFVEVLGGLTANTEFEALTGDTIAFLSASAIPYQLQVDHEMASIARTLQAQGYETMAMHPSSGSAWNRSAVYDYFGFDEFIEIEDFRTPYEYVGNFISDTCNFNEIIYQYEHHGEEPFFLFDVTIQNHADYYGQVETPIAITMIGDTPAEEVAYTYDTQTYLNLMKVTDDAFKELVSYFETVEEPTIICMFGDHQPNLDESFYEAIFAGRDLTEEEKTSLKYITTCAIWANYDVDLSAFTDMSANYVAPVLLNVAGVELSGYDTFLLNLKNTYPIITLRNVVGFEEDELVNQYKILQYYHLIDQ